MNIWDVVILLAVAAAVGLAVRHVVKKKGSACSCGCSGCSGTCGERTEKNKSGI